MPGPNGAASNEQGLSLYGTLTQAQNLPENQINPGNIIFIDMLCNMYVYEV